MQTKVKRKNERDEFSVFCEREWWRLQGVMKKMVVLTGEAHEEGGSTWQELCGRKIFW